MAHFMRVNGASAKRMESGSCTMRTVTSMKGNGWRIKQTGGARIHMRMVQSMSASGRTISSMALGWRLGLMELFMRACTRRVKSMEAENLLLPMALYMKENST